MKSGHDHPSKGLALHTRRPPSAARKLHNVTASTMPSTVSIDGAYQSDLAEVREFYIR